MLPTVAQLLQNRGYAHCGQNAKWPDFNISSPARHWVCPQVCVAIHARTVRPFNHSVVQRVPARAAGRDRNDPTLEWRSSHRRGTRPRAAAGARILLPEQISRNSHMASANVWRGCGERRKLCQNCAKQVAFWAISSFLILSIMCNLQKQKVHRGFDSRRLHHFTPGNWSLSSRLCPWASYISVLCSAWRLRNQQGRSP